MKNHKEEFDYSNIEKAVLSILNKNYTIIQKNEWVDETKTIHMSTDGIEVNKISVPNKIVDISTHQNKFYAFVGQVQSQIYLSKQSPNPSLITPRYTPFKYINNNPIYVGEASDFRNAFSQFHQLVNQGATDIKILKLMGLFEQIQTKYTRIINGVILSKETHINVALKKPLIDTINREIKGDQDAGTKLASYWLDQKVCIEFKDHSFEYQSEDIFKNQLIHVFARNKKLDEIALLNKLTLERISQIGEDFSNKTDMMALYVKYNPAIQSLQELIKESMMISKMIEFSIQGASIIDMYKYKVFSSISEKMVDKYLSSWLSQHNEEKTENNQVLSLDSLKELVNFTVDRDSSSFEQVKVMIGLLSNRIFRRVKLFLTQSLSFNLIIHEKNVVMNSLKLLFDSFALPEVRDRDIDIIIGSNTAKISSYLFYILHLIIGAKPMYVIPESTILNNNVGQDTTPARQSIENKALVAGTNSAPIY